MKKSLILGILILTLMLSFISAEKISLSNDDPKTDVIIAGKNYTIELVSASDGSATIKVTDSQGKSETKEIAENSEKEVNNIKIEVESADETNLKLSASIEVEAASEESEQEQDEQEKQPPKEVTPTGETGPIEIPKEETKPICNGCELDNNCYPFGYRKSGKFCSENKEFVEQSSAGNKCENNFECESNICASGECVSQGLIKKVLNWLKRLFGFD